MTDVVGCDVLRVKEYERHHVVGARDVFMSIKTKNGATHY